MKIRFKSAHDDNPTELFIRIRGIVARMFRLLGISGVDLAKTTVNGVEKYFADRIVFFEFAPESLRDIAGAYKEALSDILGMVGLLSFSIELSDSESLELKSLFGGDNPGTYRADELVKLVRENDGDGDEDRIENLVKHASASTVEDENARTRAQDEADGVFDASDAVAGNSGDFKIAAVYDAIADMIPIEGRDYLLNPVIRDSGAVGFNPVARTEIGKMWLEYLSKNLGEYLANHGSVPVDGLYDVLEDENDASVNS